MDQIRQFLERRQKVTDSDWQLIASKLKKSIYPKKHLLLQAGKIENRLSFVNKGIVRFYIPNGDKELTFIFIFDNSFVCAYDSFLTRTESKYNVETLTESTLWSLSYDDLQCVYDETCIGNVFGRLGCEDLFLRKSKRELSLLNESAEQRYLNLFIEQPKLIEQIPLKYIASYIGITPQALSRIRKRIS